MFKALVSDFSRTLLSPKDENYSGGLNALYKSVFQEPDFEFWAYFTLNERLFDFYRSLKGELKLALFTTEYIQDDPAIRDQLADVFAEILVGDKLKLNKVDLDSYTRIAEELGLAPEEILYVDDKKENLYAAQRAGMTIVRFESEEQTIADIEHALTAGNNR